MTEVVAIDPEIEVSDGVVDVVGETAEVGEGLGLEELRAEVRAFMNRPMIPVGLLTAHPGNVREDRQASTAFCRSVAKVGILTPLLITLEPDGSGFRVVDGNIRLDAAVKVGLEMVPYTFNAEAVDNEGLQRLHMLVTSRYRTDLTVKEEAAALFSASEFGMSQADIRQATGLKASEIKQGIKAGTLGKDRRAEVDALDYEWTLEELAILSQFQDDEDMMQRLLRSRTHWNRTPLKYTVTRIQDERALDARRAAVLLELESSGVVVAAELPRKGAYLADLLDGDLPMDAESHAGCPGRAATLSPYGEPKPRFYCADPKLHQHVWAATRTTDKPRSTALPGGGSSGGEDVGVSMERKVVIEGNLAWPAASKVRQEFLAEFLTRKSPPKELTATIARFVTLQYLTMPEPLCKALASAKNSQLFNLHTRLGKHASAETLEKTSQPGLWILALAPIASAFEREMVGDGERRNTWRQEMYSPCGFADAGAWLRFCITLGAEHGWEPSPIERAVAEGRAYRGDVAEAESLNGGGGGGESEEYGTPLCQAQVGQTGM